MTIHIIDDSPDVYLTPDQYARYLAEYQQAFMFYSGVPPTFESWVRRRQPASRHPPHPSAEQT